MTTEWKRRILTVPLSRDGRPVKELQDLEPGQEQSDRDHRRDAEEKTAAEVKALEDSNRALAQRVARLEADEIPLPEYSVGVSDGDVGGNVPRTREPPARKGQEGDSQPSYRVRVRGDTVGKGD